MDIVIWFALFLLASLFTLSTGCQTNPKPLPEGKAASSLCILDPDTGMCWIKKSEGRGRPISSMSKEYALDRHDLGRILDRLNRCETNQAKADARRTEVLKLMAREPKLTPLQ